MKASFMSGDGTYDPEFIRIAGPENAEGSYLTFIPDQEKLPTAKRVVDAYKKRFGEVGPYSLYSYEAINIALQGMVKAGAEDGQEGGGGHPLHDLRHGLRPHAVRRQGRCPRLPLRHVAGAGRQARPTPTGFMTSGGAFLQQIVNGLTVGAVYALIALGYTMVYGIIELINFAHGEIYMIGAYIGTIARRCSWRAGRSAVTASPWPSSPRRPSRASTASQRGAHRLPSPPQGRPPRAPHHGPRPLHLLPAARPAHARRQGQGLPRGHQLRAE